jgi:predicted nucleotidyltransferase
MGPPVTRDLIQAVVEAVVRAARPERVVLFGSWARGDAGPESDIDLLVVEADPFTRGRSRRREAARVSRALAGFLVPIDLLLYSADEVERWRDTPNHVVARAAREGQIVYERS